MYCILIPVYKEDLNCCEKLSLNQLYKIIGDHKSVYLICPKGLNTDNYKKIYPSIKVKEFDKKYFKSTATYSQLLINYKFYKSFDKYEYMYIYQLDCYLIEDKLEEWCNKGYDYIGGPILSNDAGWKNYNSPDKWEPQVGNGGFSLRKISVFKDITDPNGEFRTSYNLTDEQLKNIIFEDKYFCNDIYNYYDLEKPSWIESLDFAIDMNADVVYNILKKENLPMCIHAWGKNIRYWKTVINDMNNKEIIDYCENLYKDYFKIYYSENNSTYRKNKDEEK